MYSACYFPNKELFIKYLAYKKILVHCLKTRKFKYESYFPYPLYFWHNPQKLYCLHKHIPLPFTTNKSSCWFTEIRSKNIYCCKYVVLTKYLRLLSRAVRL